MGKYLLKLYVAGDSPRSRQAIANVRRICDDALGQDADLDIVDITQEPQVAEQEKILATPTLVKLEPPPVRRLIGDLSRRETVLAGLDIDGQL